jgi:hypothetical protein
MDESFQGPNPAVTPRRDHKTMSNMTPFMDRLTQQYFFRPTALFSSTLLRRSSVAVNSYCRNRELSEMQNHNNSHIFCENKSLTAAPKLSRRCVLTVDDINIVFSLGHTVCQFTTIFLSVRFRQAISFLLFFFIFLFSFSSLLSFAHPSEHYVGADMLSKAKRALPAWMAEVPQKPAAKQARLESYFSPLPTMKSSSAPNRLAAPVLPAPSALTAASVATSVPDVSASSHQDPEILGNAPCFANEAEEISYNEHKVSVSEQPEWVPCCENPDATVYKDGRYKGTSGKFSAAAPRAGAKYTMIWLPGDKSVALHRLVYFSYYPENQKFAKDRNYVVDHIDGNPLNNKLENLRLLTVAQNTQSAHDVGLVDKTNLATNVEFVYEDKSTEIFVFLKDAAIAAMEHSLSYVPPGV